MRSSSSGAACLATGLRRSDRERLVGRPGCSGRAIAAVGVSTWVPDNGRGGGIAATPPPLGTREDSLGRRPLSWIPPVKLEGAVLGLWIPRAIARTTTPLF